VFCSKKRLRSCSVLVQAASVRDERAGDSSVKRVTTLIIVIITFLEGVASLTAAPCLVTSSLVCGSIIPALPTHFSLAVSDSVDLQQSMRAILQ